MNKITVIGAGYVGFATTLALASEYNRIDLIESDKKRYTKLKWGYAPINESDVQSRFNEVKDYINPLNTISSLDLESRVIFICVGTPTTDNGDLNIESIYVILSSLFDSKYSGLIIIKSTLNLGDTEKLSKLYPNLNIAFSPEFLRESTAIRDAMNPDRVIIGFSKTMTTAKRRAFSNLFNKIYRKGLSDEAFMNATFLNVDSNSAELIKLASNSYLALRLTYFNELSILCQHANISIDEVMDGIRLDPRIGAGYSKPSIGYAGPCLPKDTVSLAKYANNYRAPLRSLEGAIESNTELFNEWVDLIDGYLKKYKIQRILFLGIAFKDYSDDTRTSLTVKLMDYLKPKVRGIEIYDPRCNKIPNKLEKFYDMIIVSSSEYIDFCKTIVSKVIIDLKSCTKGMKLDNVEYLGK